MFVRWIAIAALLAACGEVKSDPVDTVGADAADTATADAADTTTDAATADAADAAARDWTASFAHVFPSDHVVDLRLDLAEGDWLKLLLDWQTSQQKVEYTAALAFDD